MYILQKRKTPKSQWHTVKESTGKKCSYNTESEAIKKMSIVSQLDPSYDYRVIDGETNNVLHLLTFDYTNKI